MMDNDIEEFVTHIENHGVKKFKIDISKPPKGKESDRLYFHNTVI